MATHARGLICLCLTEERCDELGLRQMTDQNETPFGTAFTVSIEAREGVTTGISAARPRTHDPGRDRPASRPRDLVQPGHVFPLRARGGACSSAPARPRRPSTSRGSRACPGRRGLRDHERRRHDGPCARPDRLLRQHELKMITVADLIEYRRRHEKLVERIVSVRLPTAYGEFRRSPSARR